MIQKCVFFEKLLVDPRILIIPFYGSKLDTLDKIYLLHTFHKYMGYSIMKTHQY